MPGSVSGTFGKLMSSAASSSDDTSCRDEIERPRPESTCNSKAVTVRHRLLREAVPWKDSSDVRSRNESGPRIQL